MSTNKKPRGDALLKTLSEERQASIAQHLAEHRLSETRRWLASDGLKTSDRALSEFLSWWHLRSQLQRNESTVETLLEEFKSAKPDSTPEQVQAVGQSFFTALALSQQDPKVWEITQQINFKSQDARLKAIAEQRKERELELKNRSLDLELEKYRTALKDKVELAMDSFAQDLKGNPKLLEAYQRFRAEVNAAMAK